MIEQLKDINPSAKGPLYRKLMILEDLSYLREDRGIIGFEVDLKAEQKLTGFTLVGIQKHTIYAYRSDLNEGPRLVLFPSLDKLFDSTFNMLNLQVTKKLFTSPDFKGQSLGTGTFANLVQNLTPPEKDVDIPVGVSEEMVERMTAVRDKSEAFAAQNMRVEKTEEAPVAKPAEMEPAQSPQEEVHEEPEFNEFDQFDDGGYNDFDKGYNDFSEGADSYDDGGFEMVAPEEVEPVVEEPTEDPRSIELKAQSFDTLVEVGEYVHLKFKIPKSITTQVVNKALQSDVVAQKKIESKALAVMLFSKLFNEKKV